MNELSFKDSFTFSTAALFLEIKVFLEISSILSSLGWHRRLLSGSKAGRIIKYKFNCSRKGPRKNEKSGTQGCHHPPKVLLTCSLTLTTAQQSNAQRRMGKYWSKDTELLSTKCPEIFCDHSGCRWLFISELAGGFLRGLGTSEVEPSCFSMSW